MHHTTGPKIEIDLEENVLRMTFQEDPPLPDDLGPALENWDHNLVNDERFRLDTEPLDHLDQERAMPGMLQIASIKSKVRNQKPLFLIRPGNRFTDQKTPRMVTAAVSEADGVREIRKP